MRVGGTKKFNDIANEIAHEVGRKKRIFTLEEVSKMPSESTGFLVEKLIPKSSLTMIVGRSGVNKSTFCRQLGLIVSSEEECFLGYQVHRKHHRTLYVSSEDSLKAMSNYLEDQCRGFGVALSSVNMHLTHLNDFKTIDDLIDEIIEKAKVTPFDLIVLDSLSDIAVLADVDMNDNFKIRTLTTKLLRLQAATESTMVLNHHASEKSIDITNFLGASALKQVARSVIAIFAMDKSNEEDGNFRYIDHQKCNYGTREEAFECILTSEFNLLPTGRKVDTEFLKSLVQPVADIPGKKRGKLHDLTIDDIFHEQ